MKNINFNRLVCLRDSLYECGDCISKLLTALEEEDKQLILASLDEKFQKTIKLYKATLNKKNKYTISEDERLRRSENMKRIRKISKLQK